LAMLKDYHLEYPDFMRMRIADRKGNLAKAPYTLSQIRERLKKLFDEINSKAVFAINDLEISGTDIIRISGKTAGPEIGKIKHHLFKKVLDDPDLNTTQNLKQLLATIDEQSYKGLT
ncbi:MAG: CCA tRNA nucleotidyltransferase, partial [Proteobacteria bacterium]|nr:CCA tRNA nucleotidyltransferase [Pseudomonadota bacterium]